MPRKAATRKKPTSSRKASIASLADDASEVSNMDDVANLASLDDFDHKENIPESISVINTSSVADKKKMQSRSVLAKQQLLKAFDMEGPSCACSVKFRESLHFFSLQKLCSGSHYVVFLP